MGNEEKIRESDNEKAENVYLCQVSEGVSCGACCGLYNIKNLSKAKLEAMLVERTEAFASVPRTEDGIDGFRTRIEGGTAVERPFPEFHHCPFLGLIGPDKSRVGCLLHPAASGNDGKDFRWLSWYGAMACRIYFCPAHRMLPPAYQMIVRESFDHWYFYGLLVTEHRLLVAFLRSWKSASAAGFPALILCRTQRPRRFSVSWRALKSSGRIDGRVLPDLAIICLKMVNMIDRRFNGKIRRSPCLAMKRFSGSLIRDLIRSKICAVPKGAWMYFLKT